MKPESSEDVAIIGMACLLPRADTPARFWENIVGKVDCIRDAPPDWQPEVFFDEAGLEADRCYTQRGGFLGDLCRFDPIKYGVVPASVEGAEPDHYIALRCAFEASADAGFPERPLNREKTGVIVGRGLFVNRGWATVFERTQSVEGFIQVLRRLEPERSEEDLSLIRQELKRSLPPCNADTFPGLVHSALVGRIANRLDLKGPAYTVDAACSATLLAVEHAIRELRSGTCDAVIVGGSQVSIPAQVQIMFCNLDALSRRGEIAPFSAGASGTLLGQGCGMLVLKRRSDAERDGHRIYALLKSVGTSSDGKGAGLLAPRTEGQQLAIRRAYERAGILASTVTLIEAHGTGIPLGDATEIESLNACLGDGGEGSRRVAIGSVKSMIGHLIPASGVASLIKTALALYHRVLPPTLHAEQVNPELGLDRTPFYLCQEARPWLRSDAREPRRAGINAFGFGGINAHALLEEYPHRDERELARLECNWPVELVVVSARDRDALREHVQRLAEWIAAAPQVPLLDVAASCAEEAGECRVAIVARDLADLARKLGHVAKLLAEDGRERIQDRNGVYWYARPLAREGRIAFMFPGEGSQYVGMHGELCRHFPEVRRQFDLTAMSLEKGGGRSLARVLYPQPEETQDAERDLFSMETAVASVTAAGRALLDLLRRLRVEPDAVVGHSSGEFAAALAAGAFCPADETELVRSITTGAEYTARIARSEDISPATLVSVGGADPAAVEALLRESAGRVVVAMDNCPHQQILVGDEPSMERAIESLRGKGGLCQRIPWDRPYHTEAFAPLCGLIGEYLDSLRFQAPQVEMWSCIDAERIPCNGDAVRERMARQWRSPVRFRETIRAMYDDGIRLFVEVGPRGNLSAFVTDTLGKEQHAAIPMDVQTKGGIEQLCRAVGMLAAHGVEVDLAQIYRARQPQLRNLAAAPPAAAKPAPVLRLDLPMLDLDDEALARVRPIDRATGSRQRELGARAAAPVARVPAVASSTRGRAVVDFQHTMQRFLDLQRRVMTAAAPGAGLMMQVAPVTLRSEPPAPARTPLRPPPAATPTPQPASPRTAERAAPRPPPRARDPLAFIDSILEFEADRRLVAECELDLARHSFFRDHTFFGRGLSDGDPEHSALPITPLAVMLELMAEAALTLRPETCVAALCDVKIARWLPMNRPTRRVRMVAESEGDDRVRVALLEADREGMNAEIARATVELATAPLDLGPARLAEPAGKRPPWETQDLYGRVLYHGPAFRGLEDIDHWAMDCVAGRVREPDPRLLFADAAAHRLALPVQLIDTASQLPGIIHGNYWEGDSPTCKLAFPHAVERLEFAPLPARGAPMRAVARIEENSTVLRSHTEFRDEDDRVVFRYWGKVEELVAFPRDLYQYTFQPHEIWCVEDLGGLFRDVPGFDGCRVCATRDAGYRLLVNGVWAEVVARLVLDAEELAGFTRSKRVPVAAADWLLGRIAAKDAVRLHGGLRATMADVPIRSDDRGRPYAANENAPLLSLSHKEFAAVAATADPARFDGVGIDLEPIRPLDPALVDDALTAQERSRVEEAAHRAGAPVHVWQRAAWCAKEAVGKALGSGVLGGARNLEIMEADPGSGRLLVALRGAMAEALPDRTAGIEVHFRNWGDRVVALCLVPRPPV